MVKVLTQIGGEFSSAGRKPKRSKQRTWWQGRSRNPNATPTGYNRPKSNQNHFKGNEQGSYSDKNE